MNESGSAGPALVAAATPVSTKIPVPMMPPMPSSVSCVAVSARRSWLPEDSCSCSSAMDLVASSCRAMEPPRYSRGLYTSDLGKASRGAAARVAAPSALAQLGRHVRREQLDEIRVHLGSSRDDVPTLAVFRTGERSDVPAGLLDEERPGGRVPRRQPDLPEAIDATGRDIGQIERRRARAAHAGRLLRDGLQHAEVVIEVARVGAVGEAGRDEGALEGARLADAHAVIVEVRARAAAGGEQLPTHRVVDHRVLEPPADLGCDRDGKHRKAVQEVGRAVERIDDPECIVLAGPAALFGENCVLRVVTADDADDFPLGGVVDLGDEVVASLGGDGERLEAVQAPDDDLARAARGPNGNVEKRLHGL